MFNVGIPEGILSLKELKVSKGRTGVYEVESSRGLRLRLPVRVTDSDDLRHEPFVRSCLLDCAPHYFGEFV